MFETTLIAIVVIIMIIALMISIIPFIPGPALLWAIAVIFAVLDGFDRMTIPAVVIMTLMMVVGSTSDLWMRWLGMRSRGTSCWGVLGSFAGGIIGTGFMPIIGTLIGAILGALLVEFMRLGDVKIAMDAGRATMEAILLSILIEFSMSVGIFAVFMLTLWLTA